MLGSTEVVVAPTEVVVSPTPGNPFSDPGPRPPLNIDLTPPTLGNVKLAKTKLKAREQASAVNIRRMVRSR